MNIILSSRNPSKIEQIKAIFNTDLIGLKTLEEAGIEGEAKEDGLTLEENAYKKAFYAFENYPFKNDGTWFMADDSGIFINALDGRPGVISARWAGENASTEETMRYCLDQLNGSPDRTATFETCVVLISSSGEEQKTFVGKVDGYLLEKPRVNPQPKMPYSPLFVPIGYAKCWAEMTTDEENAISHRGIAFRQVRKYLFGENHSKLP